MSRDVLQPSLFDQPRSIEERFLSFHLRHPEVLEQLLRLTDEARARGRQRIGIRMLWERMRWYMTVEQDAAEEFKLNDHYHSRYARLICEVRPDLAHMFELRELRAV